MQQLMRRDGIDEAAIRHLLQEAAAGPRLLKPPVADGSAIEESRKHLERK